MHPNSLMVLSDASFVRQCGHPWLPQDRVPYPDKTLHHTELKGREQGPVWVWHLLTSGPFPTGQQNFDLLVIGGGSGGLACAKEGM